MNTTTPTKTVETVVKITSTMPSNCSYLLNPNPKMYGEKGFYEAAQEMADFAKTMTNMAGLISYIRLYPTYSVEKAISAFFGDIFIDIKKKTKKTKQYWIPFLLRSARLFRRVPSMAS